MTIEFFFIQPLQFAEASCLGVIDGCRKCEQPMAANEKFRNNVVMEMAPVNTAHGRLSDCSNV